MPVSFPASLQSLEPSALPKYWEYSARLSKRDGKPIYLNHIPRVSRYLKRNLEHPDLAVLKSWYERNLPL